MPVRSILAVTWTCDACGAEVDVATGCDEEHPPIWPVLPGTWRRSDAYRPARITCSDACRLWKITGGLGEFALPGQDDLPF